MKALADLTVPEKIVWFFDGRGIKSAHRRAIESLLRIAPEQWDQSIGRARDIAKEDHDLSLIAVYDRTGWWTVNPTIHIAAVAVNESNRRNATEAERNARDLADLDGVSKGAAFVTAAQWGIRNAFETELAVHIAVKNDYVVEEIDAAMAAGRDVVERARS